MGRFLVLVANLGLALLVGCSAPDRRDLEYRISKAEGERDQLQLALDDEYAKVAILQERLATEQQTHELARAEVDLTRERLRQLERDNKELLALLERRDDTGIERPQVPAFRRPAR